jgi:serine phosphatase RsbU (regulator of sigma subunit)
VLAVLVAVVVAGVRWGMLAACISLGLITYFFVEPRGPHLTLDAIPVLAVFAATVAVAGVLARMLARARDRANESLAERELALLELAHQIDRERAVTRAFQSAVLQEQLPNPGSATLEAFYQPAESLYEIGGDWYDVLEHRDGRVTVTVGDIGGKGVAAAAEMVRLSKALRIFAAEGYAPGELLARADTSMLDGTLREAFATAVCATFDPASGKLEYATAGHPAPLLVRASGEAEFLDAGASPPLTTGLVGQSSETVALFPGDSVLFYTDGLIERRGRGLDRGLDELVRVCVVDCPQKLTVGEIVARMAAGTAPEDDVCVVRLVVGAPVSTDSAEPCVVGSSATPGAYASR